MSSHKTIIHLEAAEYPELHADHKIQVTFDYSPAEREYFDHGKGEGEPPSPSFLEITRYELLRHGQPPLTVLPRTPFHLFLLSLNLEETLLENFEEEEA